MVECLVCDQCRTFDAVFIDQDTQLWCARCVEGQAPPLLCWDVRIVRARLSRGPQHICGPFWETWGPWERLAARRLGL